MSDTVTTVATNADFQRSFEELLIKAIRQADKNGDRRIDREEATQAIIGSFDKAYLPKNAFDLMVGKNPLPEDEVVKSVKHAISKVNEVIKKYPEEKLPKLAAFSDSDLELMATNITSGVLNKISAARTNSR